MNDGTRRPLRPLSPVDQERQLRELNLGPDLLPLDLTQTEREAAQEPQMEAAPTVVAKTPVLKDKRFALAIATVVSLLLAAFLKVEIPAETIAAVVTVVIGAIAASAAKEATVSKAIVNAEK